MRGAILGTLASLLSAAAALIVVQTGVEHVNPLWLLLAQYLVGVSLAPPRRWPVASVKLHALRLLAGLWAFGGYYLALASPGVSASNVSMLLSTAPVFSTFIATRNRTARFAALVAFAGVVVALRNGGGSAVMWAPNLLILTAAVAYAASFLLLGNLAAAGEAPSTTSSVYNVAASALVTLTLVVVKPAAPSSWLPIAAVGVIAALRVQILTIAASSPSEVVRVSVLSNLSFVWLVIMDSMHGTGAHWGAVLLVVAGTLLVNLSDSRLSSTIKQSSESRTCSDNSARGAIDYAKHRDESGVIESRSARIESSRG